VRVVDTLTEADWVTVVAFSNDATIVNGDKALLRATEDNKELVRGFIKALSNGGTTNFGAALELAISALDHSSRQGATSGCHKVILFMSDGEPTAGSWRWEEQESVAEGLSKLTPKPLLFTYAFGSGADGAVLKDIACKHNGVAYAIADGGNIADVMAGYYKVLSPMSMPCTVRWSNYTDVLTGQPLLAACLASYKMVAASSPTSCAEGEPDCLLELLAVTCIDMGLMVSMEVLEVNAGWADFWSKVQQEQQLCSPVTITEAQMQYIRQEAQTRGGGAGACPAPQAEPSACKAPPGPPGEGGSAQTAEEGGSAGMIVGVAIGAVVALMVAAFFAKAVCNAKSTRSNAAGSAAASHSTSSSVGGRDPYAARPVTQARPIAQAQPVVAQAQPMPVVTGTPVY